MTNKTLLVSLIFLGLGTFGFYTFNNVKEISSPITKKERKENTLALNNNEVFSTKISPHNIIDEKKHILSDKTETAESVQIVSQESRHFNLDTVLSDEKEFVLFDSTKIEKFTVLNTQEMILELSNNLYELESQKFMVLLEETAHQNLEKFYGTQLDTSACSDSLCGVLISASTEGTAISAISSFIDSPNLKSKLNGGTIRVFEEDGTYYGMLIGAIGTKPLKIK